MREQPLPLDRFRCPNTGGLLTAEPDGTWVGPEGDRYPEIEGLRHLVARDGGKCHQVVPHYESLSDALEARSGTYLSPGSFRRTAEAVKRMTGSPEGLRILDAGCGQGVVSLAFAAHNHVVGVDLAPSLLQRAAKVGHEVYMADAARLPFQPGHFDLVLCINLIQMVHAAQPVIQSVAEVTRAGGEVLIAIPNGECVFRRLFRLLLRCGFRPRGIPVETYPAPWPLAQIKALLAGTALEIIEVGSTFAPTAIFRTAPRAGLVRRLLADNYYIRLRKAESAS